MRVLYLRKTYPDHPFWAFAQNRPDAVEHQCLRQLIDREQAHVGEHDARAALAWLARWYRGDGERWTKVPVVVVDGDGCAVSL